MTPTEKWPAVRARLLVTAMLMLWLPMARSQQEVYPAWFNPWPEDKVAARPSPSPAAHRKLQRKPLARVVLLPLGPFPQSLARNSRVLRAPSILAGLHWGAHRAQPFGGNR